MIRFGKLLISELTEYYKPGTSPSPIRKTFITRFLSFNFQEQFKPSFIVTKTSIVSSQSEKHFILVISLHRHSSGTSAPMFCFPFGGVIIV